MDRDREALVSLGIRLRRGRLRRRWTQAALAALTGVSDSTISRMELGDGGPVPLATWLTVAGPLGIDILAEHRPGPAFDAAMIRLAAPGGWQPGDVWGDARCFRRAARPVPGLRHLIHPSERMVVRVVRTLTDLVRESARLGDAAMGVSTIDDDGAIGRLLVIVATTANRRCTGTASTRSDQAWIRALRDPATRMPDRQGLVWLAPRGTHLLPGW